MKKDPTNASIYVVLGNTYAAVGMCIWYLYNLTKLTLMK